MKNLFIMALMSFGLSSLNVQATETKKDEFTNSLNKINESEDFTKNQLEINSLERWGTFAGVATAVTLVPLISHVAQPKTTAFTNVIIFLSGLGGMGAYKLIAGNKIKELQIKQNKNFESIKNSGFNFASTPDFIGNFARAHEKRIEAEKASSLLLKFSTCGALATLSILQSTLMQQRITAIGLGTLTLGLGINNFLNYRNETYNLNQLKEAVEFKVADLRSKSRTR